MTQIKERVMQRSTSKIDLKRQQNFEDYGYAGDKCATQYKNLIGDCFISTPALRKETDDKFNLNVFVAA